MRKGWFRIAGMQDGDRTLEQQLKGLAPLIDEVEGRTILDLGCAEGLLARHLLERGAAGVHGVEIVEQSVAAARIVCDGLAATFQQADIDRLAVPVAAQRWDIVLMLAILHKLRDPGRVARLFGACAGRLCVVRLPPQTAPVVIDPRSGSQPHDIAWALGEAGLHLERVERGHCDEWTGYFRRA